MDWIELVTALFRFVAELTSAPANPPPPREPARIERPAPPAATEEVRVACERRVLASGATPAATPLAYDTLMRDCLGTPLTKTP